MFRRGKTFRWSRYNRSDLNRRNSLTGKACRAALEQFTRPLQVVRSAELDNRFIDPDTPTRTDLVAAAATLRGSRKQGTPVKIRDGPAAVSG